MNDLKQTMYVVTDFARMRTENAYFVDRFDLTSGYDEVKIVEASR